MRVLSNLNEMTQVVRNQGMNPDNASPSELRRGVVLTSNESIILDFKSNISNKLASDELVDISDAFIVTGIGFALFKVASATPTDAQIMQATRHQFANTNTGVFDGSTESVSLPAIYNASAEIKSNTTTLYPRLPMKFLQRVPELQQGMPLVYDSTANATERATASSAEPNGYYCIPVKPITLNGDQTLKMTIDLKASMDFAETGETNYAEVVLRGYYINDGANL